MQMWQHLNWGVSEGLSDKVTPGWSSERDQAGTKHIEGEECPRQGNSKNKDQEVGTC